MKPSIIIAIIFSCAAYLIVQCTHVQGCAASVILCIEVCTIEDQVLKVAQVSVPAHLLVKNTIEESQKEDQDKTRSKKEKAKRV